MRPFGPLLGYPVLGCPPMDCVDPMQPAAAAFAPWAYFGPAVSPLVVQQLDQPVRFLRPRCPEGILAVPIGLGCACIDPGEEVTLECCVGEITTLKALKIPASVAAQLLVTDITVAGTRLLLCGAIPAALFTADSMIATFASATANEGECICITLRNISKSEVELSVGALVVPSSR